MRTIILVYLVFNCTRALCQSRNVDSFYITTSDSTKLFVKRSGNGYPVLFIHGGPGSNSFYFEKEGGDVFSKKVQLIYLDQRGCGRSDSAANGDYSLNRVVKDFDEVRQKLAYRQWMVIAHSFGGILATQYAQQYKSTIRAMVYLNCTVNLTATAKSGIEKGIELLGNDPGSRRYFNDDSIPLFTRWREIFGRLQEKGIAYKIMFDKKENKEYDDSLMALPFLKYIYAQRMWNYPEYFSDFSSKTAEIDCPVLVITGTSDYTIGVDHYKLMRFPNMRVKSIKGGHALYLEHNKKLYKAIAPFLKKHD